MIKILKMLPDGSYFMRETASRPTRCFECSIARKHMYFYWMQTPENRQKSRSKFDLPFCCVEHYRKYMKRIAPLPPKVTIDS